MCSFKPVLTYLKVTKVLPLSKFHDYLCDSVNFSLNKKYTSYLVYKIFKSIVPGTLCRLVSCAAEAGQELGLILQCGDKDSHSIYDKELGKVTCILLWGSSPSSNIVFNLQTSLCIEVHAMPAWPFEYLQRLGV